MCQITSPATQVGDVGGGGRGVGLADEAGDLFATFQLDAADAEGSWNARDEGAEEGRWD